MDSKRRGGETPLVDRIFQHFVGLTVAYNLIDLSQPLSPGTPVDALAFKPSIKRATLEYELYEDLASERRQRERLTLSTHTGTHLTTGRSRHREGTPVDMTALHSFVGEAVVYDVREHPGGEITPVDLEFFGGSAAIEHLHDRIVLFGTGWGYRTLDQFDPDDPPPYVSPPMAAWLVERGVRGVGIDFFRLCHSCCGPKEAAEAESTLLDAGIWILEGLRFPDRAFRVAQPCNFWALPIHVVDCGAAWCRPVLAVEVNDDGQPKGHPRAAL